MLNPNITFIFIRIHYLVEYVVGLFCFSKLFSPSFLRITIGTPFLSRKRRVKGKTYTRTHTQLTTIPEECSPRRSPRGPSPGPSAPSRGYAPPKPATRDPVWNSARDLELPELSSAAEIEHAEKAQPSFLWAETVDVLCISCCPFLAWTAFLPIRQRRDESRNERG